MSRLGTRAVLFLVAAALGGIACASTGAVPRPFPTAAPAPAPAPAPAAPRDAPDRPVATSGTVLDTYALVGTALSLRGAPYRNGGTTPDGFDCSGFVWYVFAQHGLRIPRTVTEQFAGTSTIAADAIAPGDLLFFDTSGGVSHVAMAIGGDEFVHAPSGRGEVRVERLSAPYWSHRFVGARRIGSPSPDEH